MRVLALFGSVAIFGSERGNLEVLAALQEEGARVLIVASDADYADEAREYLNELGFEICRSPYFIPPRPDYKINPWVYLPLTVLRASARLLAIHRRFKPTHLHAGNQMAVLNFLPALAMLRTPLVYRCGDAPVLHNRVWRFTWWFVAKRTTRFVAVSRYIAGLMSAAGARSDRISVIYSRPPMRPRSTGCRRSGGRINIGYVGQVIERKGVGLLVEAFDRVSDDFPEAKLLIAGRISDWVGDQWGRELRERTLANPRLRDRVEFAGYVEDVPAFFARCLVHVAPTLSEEPMGNTVMEAKAAALPSIIFNSGGFPEVVEHGVTGYICPERSVAALEEALRLYLGSPEDAEIQGAAAARSLAQLGVAEFSSRWAEVYRAANAR